jgi:hypothetical protein
MALEAALSNNHLKIDRAFSGEEAIKKILSYKGC